MNISHNTNLANTDKALSELNSDIEWKNLTQINNAQGKSFSYPNGEWKELKIYAKTYNGTDCTLEVNIIKKIITETVQYVGSTVYASPTSFDTAIFAFSTKGVTVHNLIAKGTSNADGIINVFYR